MTLKCMNLWNVFSPYGCSAHRCETNQQIAACSFCSCLNAVQCCMLNVMVCHILYVFLWSGCTSCASLLPQMEIHNALHWRTCWNILQVQQSNFSLHQYVNLVEDSALYMSTPAAYNVNKVLNSILMLSIVIVVLYTKIVFFMYQKRYWIWMRKQKGS